MVRNSSGKRNPLPERRELKKCAKGIGIATPGAIAGMWKKTARLRTKMKPQRKIRRKTRW